MVDAGEVDFRRVLGRRDIAVFLVQDIEACVQRYRLTGTGRAGHENHAVRLREVLLVERALVVFVTQLLDTELRAGRVEDTQHDLLAEQRRARIDTEVDRAVLRQAHLDTAVLRHTSFRDVHA